MQGTKNISLILSLALLSIVSLCLMIFSTDKTVPVIDPDYFKVLESEKIDRVVLNSTSGIVELRFENNQWIVNGKWGADMQMIKVLFATLRQVEPRRPVAAKLKDSVRQSLQNSGTQVSVFQGSQMVSKFYAGGNSLKTEASFLRDGDSQPYQMAIPGYRVYVAGILELNENGWRNKRVFDFNWRNFRHLAATYAKEPAENFEVEMKDRYPVIKNLPKVDTAKLNNYMDAISLLFAKRFVSTSQPGIDSLTKVVPLARIEIQDIASRSFSLELYSPRKNDHEVFGKMSDGQFIALDKKSIGDIVKKRSYFAP